jgi:hypothetical protein
MYISAIKPKQNGGTTTSLVVAAAVNVMITASGVAWYWQGPPKPL